MKSDADFVGYLLSLLLLCAIITYGGYRYVVLENSQKDALRDIALLQAEITATTKNLNQSIAINRELAQELQLEQGKLKTTEEILKEAEETVEELELLRELDPELLQKYSRVYFLNEHYEPGSLRTIREEYTYKKNEPEKIHTDVSKYLDEMLEDASRDGVSILVLSAYRSFEEQKRIKGQYTVLYGSGANQFSADQGYSEHQLGTTLDFTTPNLQGALDGFENTPEYTWLLSHAHRYGFSLSYPKGNSFYIFEPWHWRFVGTKLATELYKRDMSIYDMDQRELDEYLVSIFD